MHSIEQLIAKKRAGESWSALAELAGCPESTLRNRFKAAFQVDKLGDVPPRARPKARDDRQRRRPRDPRPRSRPIRSRMVKSMDRQEAKEPTVDIAAKLKHFREAQVRHPGMVLVFREGDHYETFEDHAHVIGLTCDSPMYKAGGVACATFPTASLEQNLRRLLKAGHRVALCDPVASDQLVTRPWRGRFKVDHPVDPTPDRSPGEALANGRPRSRLAPGRGQRRGSAGADTSVDGGPEPAPGEAVARRIGGRLGKGALLLPANLGKLTRLAGKEMPYSNSWRGTVRLTCTDGGYRAEATDGRVLGIVTGPAAATTGFPDLLKKAEKGSKVAVVPAKTWEQAFKSAPRDGLKPILQNVAAAIGKTKTTLATTDLARVQHFEPAQVQCRYPDTDSAFPKGKPKAVVHFDPKLLGELLTVAAGFTKEDSSEVELVLYEEAKKGKKGNGLVPVLVRAANGDQKFQGLIMPMEKNHA